MAGKQGIPKEVEELIHQYPVLMFAKAHRCPYSKKAKALFDTIPGLTGLHIVNIDEKPNTEEYQEVLETITGERTVPRIFIGGHFWGGCDQLVAAHADGTLLTKLKSIGAISNERDTKGQKVVAGIRT